MWENYSTKDLPYSCHTFIYPYKKYCIINLRMLNFTVVVPYLWGIEPLTASDNKDYFTLVVPLGAVKNFDNIL